MARSEFYTIVNKQNGEQAAISIGRLDNLKVRLEDLPKGVNVSAPNGIASVTVWESTSSDGPELLFKDASGTNNQVYHVSKEYFALHRRSHSISGSITHGVQEIGLKLVHYDELRILGMKAERVRPAIMEFSDKYGPNDWIRIATERNKQTDLINDSLLTRVYLLKDQTRPTNFIPHISQEEYRWYQDPYRTPHRRRVIGGMVGWISGEGLIIQLPHKKDVVISRQVYAALGPDAANIDVIYEDPAISERYYLERPTKEEVGEALPYRRGRITQQTAKPPRR